MTEVFSGCRPHKLLNADKQPLNYTKGKVRDARHDMKNTKAKFKNPRDNTEKKKISLRCKYES